MATTKKLNDTHLVILSHAAQTLRGQVLPLPASVGNKGGAAIRTLKSLLRRGLVEVVTAKPDDQEWGRDEDGKRMTLAITPAGLEAIGIAEDSSAPATKEGHDRGATDAAGGSGEASGDIEPETETVRVDADAPIAIFRSGTKGAAIVDLLRRKEGASLSDLMAASTWQAHSVRGFLSGTLRKKHGLNLASAPDRAGIRRYRIGA